MDNVTLLDLALAANYLDVKGLMDLSCKSLANLIRGKTPNEIKVIFNLTHDTDFPTSISDSMCVDNQDSARKKNNNLPDTDNDDPAAKGRRLAEKSGISE